MRQALLTGSLPDRPKISTLEKLENDGSFFVFCFWDDSANCFLIMEEEDFLGGYQTPTREYDSEEYSLEVTSSRIRV